MSIYIYILYYGCAKGIIFLSLVYFWQVYHGRQEWYSRCCSIHSACVCIWSSLTSSARLKSMQTLFVCMCDYMSITIMCTYTLSINLQPPKVDYSSFFFFHDEWLCIWTINKTAWAQAFMWHCMYAGLCARCINAHVHSCTYKRQAGACSREAGFTELCF
jgi:hypothetical protein